MVPHIGPPWFKSPPFITPPFFLQFYVFQRDWERHPVDVNISPNRPYYTTASLASVFINCVFFLWWNFKSDRENFLINWLVLRRKLGRRDKKLKFWETKKKSTNSQTWEKIDIRSFSIFVNRKKNWKKIAKSRKLVTNSKFWEVIWKKKLNSLAEKSCA